MRLKNSGIFIALFLVILSTAAMQTGQIPWISDRRLEEHIPGVALFVAYLTDYLLYLRHFFNN